MEELKLDNQIMTHHLQTKKKKKKTVNIKIK